MTDAPKRRDAEATRQKILEAARIAFTAKGYEAAGVREICTNAGVDQALIKRYFGSKQKLFEAVFNSAVGIHTLLAGPKETLGLQLAEYFASKERDDHQFDATIALLHSIGSQDVNRHIKHILESQFIDRLASHIGGKRAEQRAALIISQLLGFDVLRRVLGVEALSAKHKAQIVKTWASQIQQLVDV